MFHHTILSERWQPRTVEQLVDMIVSQVMDKIVEVGRLADRPPSRAAHREIVEIVKDFAQERGSERVVERNVGFSLPSGQCVKRLTG